VRGPAPGLILCEIVFALPKAGAFCVGHAREVLADIIFRNNAERKRVKREAIVDTSACIVPPHYQQTAPHSGYSSLDAPRVMRFEKTYGVGSSHKPQSIPSYVAYSNRKTSRE